MRKLKLFLDVKAANTPPRGISKASRVIFSVLTLLLLSVGNVWAVDDVINNAATSSALGSTGTTTWKNPDPVIVGASGASYTIHSMGTQGTSNALQFNKNGFLYQTTSGGTLASVTIKGAAKKFNIYASNSAYSEKATGTALTQITASSTGVTYTFTSNYKYLAINGTESSSSITEITVTYSTSGGDPVPVTGISLDEDDIVLEVGETQTLVATIEPGEATDQVVSWESDDENVASVDENGVVTAEGIGTATITVTTHDGDFTATCDVEVIAAQPKSSLILEDEYKDSGATAEDGAEWVVTSDAPESVYEAARGIHFGTGSSSQVQYVQLTTLDISGTITKVVVNASDATGTAEISVSVGGTDFTCSGSTTVANTNPGSNYTFTGSASGEIVVLIDRGDAAYKAIYVKSVIVSYIADQKQPAGLAYNEADQKNEVKLGNTFTAPELTNPNGLSVSYASNNTAVAEVASNGDVTIKAVGVAEITASFAGNDDYKAGSAKYTIGVVAHAGTQADPYVAADAKIAIDAMGTVENAYATGVVSNVVTTTLPQDGYITFYFSVDGLTSGQQVEAYKCYGLNSAPFEAVTDVVTGATVVVTGTLKKFNSTYEFDQNCHLVSYTAPAAPKTPIANDQAHPYTVAQAITFAADGVTYDLDDYVYVQGVVYDIKSFNTTNGTLDIYIKDAGEENQFELYKCAGINDGVSTTPFEALTDVQEGDEVIAYGQLTVFNTMSELKSGNYLVELTRPEVAVSSVAMTESTAEVEVGSTVTLHASVDPGNATDQGIVWSVTSGSDKASVDENGVVTGTAAGEAVIRAASHEDASIYEECTVTVTAVDPTVHHVTFIAGTDQSDETSITKDGITISATTFNNDNYYQCYSGEAMTVSSTVGNITKIEFTCTTEGTAKYGPGNWDFTGYSYSGANGSWTGSAETVEFGNASQQVRMTLITVTYKEDNRAAAGLAWNPADDIEITVGDAFSAPALLNPNSIAANEITISSDNTELATVTAGVVALVADATGTATITATFAGNDDYKPATISYNITVNEAGLDNVTFDSSEDHAESGETTITKGGFTLSFTSGSMDGTQAEYRLYKGQTMTLSSTDYKIKKIEFTCTSGNPISGFADATGLDKDNNEWTGESNTVELTASNAQVRMTKIKVFYVDDTRAAAGLAWNPADNIELTVGGAFSAPALYNPNNIAENLISITSSNESVATVSEGEVSLVADATGTTTITATFAGNDDYKPATVSYKITVNPAYSIYVSPSLNVNFGSVEQDAEVADKKISVTFTNVPAATLTLEGAGASAFTISPAAAMTESGDITISASSANVGTFAATLTISDDDNNAESKVVNLSITVNEPVIAETPVSTSSKWVPATEIADGMQVLITGVKSESTYAMGASSSNGNNRTSVAGSFGAEDGAFVPGEGTMSFTLVATGAANTYYIKTSNNQYLYNASSSTKSYLKTKAEQEDVSWTITLDADNNAVITSVENTNRQIMRFNYNGGSPLFNCYASGQDPIKLYVPKQDTPVEPTSEDVRTGLEINRYYTICLAKNVTAATGATFWSLTNRNAAGTEVYLEEVTLPLEAGKPYIFRATAETLNVTYGDETQATPVANGALRGTFEDLNATQLAAKAAYVYILIQNTIAPAGGENSLKANRAYIDYEVLTPGYPAPGRRVVAMPMQGQTATGCENIQAGEAPVKMMIDGQLFIIRGEKMYDTTGRLVK